MLTARYSPRQVRSHVVLSGRISAAVGTMKVLNQIKDLGSIGFRQTDQPLLIKHRGSAKAFPRLMRGFPVHRNGGSLRRRPGRRKVVGLDPAAGALGIRHRQFHRIGSRTVIGELRVRCGRVVPPRGDAGALVAGQFAPFQRGNRAWAVRDIVSVSAWGANRWPSFLAGSPPEPARDHDRAASSSVRRSFVAQTSSLLCRRFPTCGLRWGTLSQRASPNERLGEARTTFLRWGWLSEPISPQRAPRRGADYLVAQISNLRLPEVGHAVPAGQSQRAPRRGAATSQAGNLRHEALNVPSLMQP